MHIMIEFVRGQFFKHPLTSAFVVIIHPVINVCFDQVLLRKVYSSLFPGRAESGKKIPGIYRGGGKRVFLKTLSVVPDGPSCPAAHGLLDLHFLLCKFSVRGQNVPPINLIYHSIGDPKTTLGELSVLTWVQPEILGMRHRKSCLRKGAAQKVGYKNNFSVSTLLGTL